MTAEGTVTRLEGREHGSREAGEMSSPAEESLHRESALPTPGCEPQKASLGLLASRTMKE